MTSNYLFLFSIILGSNFFLGSTLPNKFSSIVVVDKSGNGNFTNIQDAIDSVPNGNKNWIHIIIRRGVYTEKVIIHREKEYIFLEGNGYSNTQITWEDHQTTDSSSTFTSEADNFVAKGISFLNNYNLKHPNEPVKPALAVKISGDKVAFYNCGFYGVQDTLFDGLGRHYYKSCYIEGSNDFIWGYGKSVFEDCNINAMTDRIPAGYGYITAQGRQTENDESGFVFLKGSVVGTGKVYLGRAYGPFSRVIFSKTMLSSAVEPIGWDAWHFSGKEEYFTNAESGCTGPGADSSQRATWTKIEKADSVFSQQFTTDKFINEDGWLANTSFLMEVESFYI